MIQLHLGEYLFSKKPWVQISCSHGTKENSSKFHPRHDEWARGPNLLSTSSLIGQIWEMKFYPTDDLQELARNPNPLSSSLSTDKYGT